MKYKKIVQLIHEVEKSGIEEFQLKDGEFSVSIRKAGGVDTDVQIRNGKMENVRPTVQIAVETETQSETQSETQPEVSIQEGTIIRSPLVGTFHASPGQGEEALAAVGARIEEGQTLGTIEAMKLMNDIVAGCTGTISEILVKDGELVEYGQSLFVIEG